MADGKPQAIGIPVSGQNNTTRIPAFDAPKKPKRNMYAFACAILASMTSILLGYGIYRGDEWGRPLHPKGPENQRHQAGSPNGDPEHLLPNRLRRRRPHLRLDRPPLHHRARLVLFFVGAVLMGFAPNYAFLMGGRFVAGVGVGYAAMIAPVYTAEVSPASSRGFLTSFPEVFLTPVLFQIFVFVFFIICVPLIKLN
ncbi:hypothetical protein C3L33_19535, partial [Rhododendron williamsianum]